MKFGGSSVGTEERIRSVAAIILSAAARERVLVVVSAMQGVTNQLLESAHAAERGTDEFQPMYDDLCRRHRSVLKSLHRGNPPGAISSGVEAILSELHDVLRGIRLLKHASPLALDMTASAGERLSAFIVASFLKRTRATEYVDSRDLVKTDDQFTHAGVLFDRTNALIRKRFRTARLGSRNAAIPIVTGFIGSTEDGRTTTLGRNGSDYSAAIFGAALKASAIDIWTDVDGILSADPRTVEAAFVLPHLTYEEAMELSYFGAKVLHAAAIAPAITNRIPVYVKNTLRPSAPGTAITHRGSISEGVAKGITAVDECTLLTLRGVGMVGVPGTAERLFRALAMNGVNVILISQASSEHTICFAVRSRDADAARKAVEREFRFELQRGLTALDEKANQTITAIVGDGMKGTPGVSGKVFQALGQNSVNVSAIAQGASERNISFVIDSSQRNRALNVIHEAFFERNKKLGVILLGVGNVGSAVLRQLHQQEAFLRSKRFDVRLLCVANSKKFVLSQSRIDLGQWKERLDSSPDRMSRLEFLRRLGGLEFTNVVVIDCTASEAVVAMYKDFIRMNMHIVTPNKMANVLPWKDYRELVDLVAARQKHFLYEANVGAGLPVISTLNDLIASGDRVVKIEGIFSGTLSFLFNQFDGRRPFSVSVQEARELGYTEPDPREDLSGNDVARKLLILARQIGLAMDLKHIRVESLVPPDLRRGPLPRDFIKRLGRHDGALQKRLESARAKGAALRYVGILQGRKAFAGIREIPLSDVFANTKESDNVVAFTTHRYART
ncbi:MAG TPA: bifunctional aspartate kinase/homoserine dehydrogenase I, partial [Bacteroidota bacterium]